MLRGLWDQTADAAEVRARSRSVVCSSDPVSFAVENETFFYDPDDMRLFWLNDPEQKTEALRKLQQEQSRRPLFEFHPPAPSMLVCIMTRACPLRCRYCFASPGSEQSVLSLATARKALAMLGTRRPRTVSFFGGEPLVAWESVRQIVAEAEALCANDGVPVSFSLTTNAVLMTDRIAAYLAAKQFSLIISLDGPPDLHNAARPDANGNGSYERVLAGLQTAARYPELARRITLRATYDGHGAHLVRRLQHLNDLADEFGLGNVSVEPAEVSEGCAGHIPSFSEKERPSSSAVTENTETKNATEENMPLPVIPSLSLYNEYMDAARWMDARIAAGLPARFFHFRQRMDRLSRRKASPSECGAGVGYVTVTPDGVLHACHRCGGTEIGDIAGGIDPQRQAAWLDNRYYQREGCGQCPYRNLCGGGCRLAGLHATGDLRKPAPLGCWLTETCFHAASWLLFRQNQRTENSD